MKQTIINQLKGDIDGFCGMPQDESNTKEIAKKNYEEVEIIA